MSRLAGGNGIVELMARASGFVPAPNLAEPVQSAAAPLDVGVQSDPSCASAELGSGSGTAVCD